MVSSTAAPARTAAQLPDRHGTLFSRELGIDLTQATPAPLFRWLCAALLMSARILHRTALDAARALAAAGWTTADKMAASAWKDRVRVLNRAGYARYDESTARMLGETADLLIAEYDGDLRNLRAAAGRDCAAQRARLKAFKGIGDVGADIFFREVQTIWTEHYPFMDAMARKAARRQGLPDDADALAELVGRERYAAVLAALVRAELADGSD
ncbi:hypothetical protein SAMN05444722_2426 [Rhodovulum sp. ES.010]|uniref:hypothetical protein n=1 Tax=Rhodovulum sp. ES.010 TaxID=1882821 RepID=UPI00092AFC90|nr:hypothetical protein [Rhodovulum sp. ES.010]SIO47554.1 hypothetical protein SAMN05444722_2426 [Rhodovulum sp. ES.010]